MSKFDRFYTKFRMAYEADKNGPQEFSHGPISNKRGTGYLDFPHRLSLGFFPVAAIRLQGENADVIGVELFSTHARGRKFLNDEFDGIEDVKLGDDIARKHINQTDGKIEFLWRDAEIKTEARWPAHFLWINLAIHTLVLACAGPLADYDKDNPS